VPDRAGSSHRASAITTVADLSTVITVDSTPNTSFAWPFGPAATMAGAWHAQAYGSGWLLAGWVGRDGPRLSATVVDLATPTLVGTRTDRFAALPSVALVGHLDGDDTPDFAGIFADPQQAQLHTLLQWVLGVEHRGQRLTGILEVGAKTLERAILSSRYLFALDLNRDGQDELVVVLSKAAAIPMDNPEQHLEVHFMRR